jgi:non-specific serine/threonine protein kinase
MLLVLDNCEHLIAGCAPLAHTLLQACPGLRILATSREPLGIAGEVVWTIPPLPIPDPHHVPPPDELAGYASVRLFCERAAAVAADVALTAENAAAVATICSCLDGLPLAIELAAARVRHLSPQQIAARLSDRFRLLVGNARITLPHQQTLRAAMDWSHDLLDDAERRAFRRLSVFRGFTLEAAEAVCPDARFDPPAGEVFDLLARLVDKSLVVAERHPAQTRYRLLETIREYGAEQLHAAGEAESAHRRHRDWFLALATRAEPELRGPQQETWFERLDTDHDNLRAALAWSLAQGEGEHQEDTVPVLRLVTALSRFWEVRGYLVEGRAWLERALGLAGSERAPLELRADALNAAGNLAREQGDYRTAQARCEQSLAIWRELGHQRGIAITLNSLGHDARNLGDYDRAAACYAEGLRLCRETGHKRGVANALNGLGILARNRGDYEQAIAYYQEGLALDRELGDTRRMAITLNNMGTVAGSRGDAARAAQFFEESLALRRALGDRRGVALALKNLGCAYFLQGNHRRAETLLAESLRLFHELENQQGVAFCLETLGEVAAAADQPARAARLLGAAEALRDTLGVPIPPAEQQDYDRAVVAARAGLTPEVFQKAWTRGRTIPLERLLATVPPVGAVPAPVTDAAPVESPRAPASVGLGTVSDVAQ